MLCRLCLVDNNNYQKLEGSICDMLRAVLRKNCTQIKDPVLCSFCVKKLQQAFDFKTTCIRSQKILSLYGGLNNKIVYLKDNKLCVSPKNDASLKLCRTCLRLIENEFGSSILGKYDILQKLSMYIPDIVISDTESSLICYKCSDHFRIFSDIINMSNEAESMVSMYCRENQLTDPEQINLADLRKQSKDSLTSMEESNIIKLIGEEDHFLLNLGTEFESTYLSDTMEDSKKRIIKKIIEEDVDLFYKEKPDFDLNESFSEESGFDSDHGNIFFGPQCRELLLSDSEEDIQRKRIRESIEEEDSSMRLSFETEESSLSPGTLSDRQPYECDSQDEGKKDDRDITSSNPFLFFNDERCSCDDRVEDSQIKSKRKCEKCKWKKALGYNIETTDHNGSETVVKKSKKDGKKCRKAYGIEFKDLWCTQCRWKKACTRFGNNKAVNKR